MWVYFLKGKYDLESFLCISSSLIVDQHIANSFNLKERFCGEMIQDAICCPPVIKMWQALLFQLCVLSFWREGR